MDDYILFDIPGEPSLRTAGSSSNWDTGSWCARARHRGRFAPSSPGEGCELTTSTLVLTASPPSYTVPP